MPKELDCPVCGKYYHQMLTPTPGRGGTFCSKECKQIWKDNNPKREKRNWNKQSRSCGWGKF